MIYYFHYTLPKRVTGANLFYKRVSEVLASLPNSSQINDFFGFISDGINRLKQGDVLVTNNGPYAFIYLYLRKRHGLSFRIVRDVQTSLHASYLFQEMACQTLQEPQDTVLFPSHYTRNLYIKLFPHLNRFNTVVCYPCTEEFPNIKRAPPKRFTVGYLGRASFDKNFHQLINVAPRLKHQILVAGQLYFKRSELPSNMKYLGEIAHEKIWDFLQKVSVLAFPSTANIESLGRVLLEANHLKVPCVTAEFGASPELCPNAVPLSHYNTQVELVHNHPLAEVDEDLFVELILSSNLRHGSNAQYAGNDLKLIKILNNNHTKEPVHRLNPTVETFISKTKIFLNGEYNQLSIEAIDTFLSQLKKEDIRDIGETSHNICESLGFVPKWRIS